MSKVLGARKLAALGALVCHSLVLQSACAVSTPDAETETAIAGDALSGDTVVTFRRGSGLDARYAREICDERTDPRSHDVVVVRMKGLRPSDVTAEKGAPNTSGDVVVTIKVNGTSDALQVLFFDVHGEDCYASGVREIRFADGTVWRSLVDLVTKAPAPGGSCAGSCGDRSRTGRCYCDGRCASHGDCCADYEPVCTDTGFVEATRSYDAASSGSITYDKVGAPGTPMEGDGVAGYFYVRYNYHRLIDSHPACVRRLADGGSAAEVQLTETSLETGVVHRYIVSGFSTSSTFTPAFDNVPNMTAGTHTLVFGCGTAPAYDTATDDGGSLGFSR